MFNYSVNITHFCDSKKNKMLKNVKIEGLIVKKC